MKIFYIMGIIIFFKTLSFAQSSMQLVYFNDFAPYSWEKNEKMQGILIDIANEAIQSRMNIPIVHTGYPWARAQKQVKTGQADAFITFPTPSRLKYTNVGDEVVIVNVATLFTKDRSSVVEQLKQVKTITDLKGIKLIDYIGNGWAKKTFISEKGFDVQWVSRVEQVYRMLAKDRGEAMVTDSNVGHYTIKRLGLEKELVEVPKSLMNIKFKLCIGKHSQYLKIIPEFDETIRRMKNEGKIQEIVDRYR